MASLAHLAGVTAGPGTRGVASLASLARVTVGRVTRMCVPLPGDVFCMLHAADGRRSTANTLERG